MRLRLLPVFALCVLSVGLMDARAETLRDKTEEAEQLANEAVTKLMRALDLLITTVPRYAAPEVLPNGDIIIRRLDPKPEDEEPLETNADADSIDT